MRRNYDDVVAGGERAARRVFEELRLKHPTEVDIDTIAFMRGALVRDINLRGAQGRLARVGRKAIISVDSKIVHRPRRRFVVAHEIGHLELHVGENQLDLCEEAAISEIYDVGTERESNAFAGEFLMPRALWERRVDVKSPNLDIICGLAEEFQVSVMASAIRFAKLCPERCAIVYSEAGQISWSASGADFRLWIPRRTRLDKYSLAYDYFKTGRLSTRPETVSASAWSDARHLGGDDDLIEHSRALPSLNAVLTLLWIPSDRNF